MEISEPDVAVTDVITVVGRRNGSSYWLDSVSAFLIDRSLPGGGGGRSSSNDNEDEGLRIETAEELKEILSPGGLTFAKRPLDIGNLVESTSVGIFMNPLDDFFDIEVLHEQIFFVDEHGVLQNIGYFGDGSIGPDPGFPGNIGSYVFGPIHRGVDISSIDFTPDGFGSGDYGLLLNNCQHYCSVIREQIE